MNDGAFIGGREDVSKSYWEELRAAFVSDDQHEMKSNSIFPLRHEADNVPPDTYVFPWAYVLT